MAKENKKVNDGLDINSVIQGGSRRMDVDDLAKLGHKKVRVIDAKRIHELITEAVKVTIAKESANSAGRSRREEAEKTQAETQERLAEYQQRLEDGELANKEIEKLREQLAGAHKELRASTDVIEEEKKRIAKDSQKEFQKLLKNQTKDIEEKKDAYESALRGIIASANQGIPLDEQKSLPEVAPEGEPVTGKALLNALNLRIETLCKLHEDARLGIMSRDQDVAMAVAERRRQLNDTVGIKKELEKAKFEKLDSQRQLDALQQDLSVAAVERRKQQEVIDRLGKQLDDGRDKLSESERKLESGDQDVAVAVAERRKQKELIERLGKQLDDRKDEVREKQRQIDQREHDIAMIGLKQREVRVELNKLRDEAAKVANLEGELRRMNGERDLLLSRIEEYRSREDDANARLDNMGDKLAEAHGSSSKTGEDLMEAISGMKGSLGEEIARQVSWAFSAQKTGAIGIDPGMQLDALFSQELETNIESVKIKEEKGGGLKDKLAKLRAAQGGGLGKK
jgi:hypothetical protein